MHFMKQQRIIGNRRVNHLLTHAPNLILFRKDDSGKVQIPDVDCTCGCRDAGVPYVRSDIVCSCCDRHSCPVHYPLRGSSSVGRAES